MTVRRDGQTIYLEGDCPVEEAEPLAALLSAPGAWTVNLDQCRHLHGALVQTLLRFRPAIEGASGAPFVRDHLGPALTDAVKTPLQNDEH